MISNAITVVIAKSRLRYLRRLTTLIAMAGWISLELVGNSISASETTVEPSVPVPQKTLTEFPEHDAAQSASIIRDSLRQHVSEMFARLSPAARRGYHHLTENIYLPADFNEDVVVQLGTLQLPTPWKIEASSAREATWRTFGISPRPEDPSKPLQYVLSQQGEYVMNCFACHGGDTYGATFPGAPNTTYALATLTEAVRRVKLKSNIPLTHMDVGSVFMPLGTTIGTSNAVMFGVALMSFRDRHLNVLTRPPAPMIHHDMDAPAWWHFSRKSHIYADGFAAKGHRGLMQFMLVRENGPESFRDWEDDFRDVYEFLSSIQPPKYPLPVNAELVARGKIAFEKHCSECHGTYGSSAYYPEVNVPIDTVGTDRIRWESLTPKHRQHYGDSWFADYGNQATLASPEGYTAPPLHGVWASAPYFHNGSVPTLWHLLHPDERPKVWRRTNSQLDTHRIGLTVEAYDQVPSSQTSVQRRWYFDTGLLGKSAAGHDFPKQLLDSDKDAVLEYLKTL